MVGRNESCPCGSGKKYKKCCERVVTLSVAEKAREDRESQLKNDLLHEFNQWFHRHMPPEMQLDWVDRFKQLLNIPPEKPIPHDMSAFFRFWLLFDAPSLNHKRPVEIWASTLLKKNPYQKRLAKSFCQSRFTCYELLDFDEQKAVYRMLTGGGEMTVKHPAGEYPPAPLIFGRFVRIGNHYELIGPYTSFLHEMRGEILLQLEKYNHLEEENKYTTWENGWRVFGWSIQRAEEMENSKSVQTGPKVSEEKTSGWPVLEEKNETLPLYVMQQFEQFFIQYVSSFQKGTQALYSQSIDKLYQYLSSRFGNRFRWEHLDEEAFIHFLSKWYLDQGKCTPQGSRVFLNTLKYFFRWLESEKMAYVYPVFRKVYIYLIRTLPVAVEVRKWLLDHGICQAEKNPETVEEKQEMSMFTFSSSGPVVYLEGKWKPVHLSAVPSFTTEQRFWIRGKLAKNETGCYFTQIDGVYPVVVFDNPAQLISQK